MADRGLTGVLLLGGASRRFGSPKALARLGAETLAERAWAVLGEACDERLAVGKAGDALPLPFSVLDDGSEVRHPAAGIAAALRAAAHDVCVVLPVDCPLVTAATLRSLGEASVARQRASLNGTVNSANKPALGISVTGVLRTRRTGWIPPEWTYPPPTS